MPTLSTRGAASVQGFKSLLATTAVDVPTIPGTAFAGGFYAGRFRLNGLLYALVVSPAASGALQRAWSTTTPMTDQNTSAIDGYFNSNINVTAARPICQAVKALTIGGFTDWYIPSRNEIEIMYRNLKPTTAANVTTMGVNPDSVPVGTAYTATDPAQTAVLAFRTGGSESFNPGLYSSTKYLTNDTYNVYQQLANGDIAVQPVNGVANYRAVRKVLIPE